MALSLGRLPLVVFEWKAIAGPAIVDNFAEVYIDIHIAGDAAKADIDALEQS